MSHPFAGLQGLADQRRQPTYDPADFLAQSLELRVVNQRTSIAEAYLQAKLKIRVELKLRVGRVDAVAHCRFVYRAVGEVPLEFKATSGGTSNDFRFPVRNSHDRWMYQSVFVDVVDGGQNLKRVRSIVELEGLEVLDCADRYLRESLEIAAPLRLPICSETDNGELKSVIQGWLTAIADRQDVDRVVESSPEVVCNFPDDEAQRRRWFLASLDPDRVYPGLHIMVVGDFELLVFDPREYRGVQILDLAIGSVETIFDRSETSHDLPPSET